MFTFHDLNPAWLPDGDDIIYFYNVQLLTIAIPVDSNILDKTIDRMWDIQRIASAPSWVALIYRDASLPEDLEYELASYPNVVIEIRDKEISWYKGE